MFLMLMGYLETVIAFLLWIILLWNARMVRKLPYQSDGRLFRKRVRWARFLYFIAMFFVLIRVGMVALEGAELGWALVEEKVWTSLLPLLLPMVFATIFTLPTLNQLANENEDSLAESSELRLSVAHPALVVPMRAAVLGSFFSYWNLLVLPTSWLYYGVIFVLFVVAVWFMEYKRYQTNSFTQSSWPMRIARKIPGLLVILVALLGWFFLGMGQSRLPDQFSMMDHQHVDFGGKEEEAHGDHSAHDGDNMSKAISVTDLKGPSGKPDRRYTLVAQKKTVRLSSGKVVDAWTFNGKLPGPELRMREGELVEVTLINKDIEEGVTIHWHGLNVPNREDGVAGVTQDAVQPGERYVYRFRVNQVGTYWYHSHQQSDLQVEKGLFGPLVVEPKKLIPEEKEITLVGHRWKTEQGETFAFGDADTVKRQKINPGTTVRLRLVNGTDYPLLLALIGTPFQVAAIDGNDIHQPDTIANQQLKLAAGGRFDVRFTMPNHPVLLTDMVRNEENDVPYDAGLLLSPDGAGKFPEVPRDLKSFEPAQYGKQNPKFHPPRSFDREFTMVFDNKMGFYDGTFNALWLINGKVFPETPMLMVREGEWVKTTFINRSGMDHPMHLHGHHMVVLSKNGDAVSGSPWWTDTLNVAPGESYEVAYYTGNPGIWMDHCHNLDHAKVGMTLHLSYEGFTSPFKAGRDTKNQPE